MSIVQKFFKSIILFSLVFSLTGCIYLMVGTVGVVGGYVVSPDTVEGMTEHAEQDVWDAAYEVVSVMGTITEEHQDGGMMIARINAAKVIISMVLVNQGTTKISVKARKTFFPKISVAQEVFVKIMSRLNE
ncbi:MAG TPA: hypothetical protein DD723_05475 [Candidatus Omnitrophica bacterium]|nr:MAG: hypothetical protein A2Z81_05575 [Omnitrophica WOR_2 bacterium GWA2_45_18]HBR14979.1 hypothetical protein [Candidatus Omnitrophota bacterium]